MRASFPDTAVGSGVLTPWLLAAAGCLCVAPVHAHDTWLSVAESTRSETTRNETGTLSLRLSTGDHFPTLEGGTAVARLARAECVSDRERRALKIGLPGDRALPMQCRWEDEAAAVAIVSLHPRDLELDAQAVKVYLGELGNDPLIAKRHAQLGRWRERYRKNAKTIIRRAPGAPLAAAIRPQGLAFELVPDSDPTLLPAGGGVRVCAFAEGVAVGPVYLGLLEASGEASWRWSDAAGCAQVTPGGSGYLLRSIRLQPSTLPGLEWTSEFASLTVYRRDAPPR